VSEAAALTLDRLSKHFGGQLAVDAVSIDVAPGELIVLLGPSGCGKTTTLRMIAGFVAPSAGDIRLDGASIADLPPHRRAMGIVFQSYALFPHLTVARNTAFGLEMRRMGASAIDARVAEMLRTVKLEAYAQRLPRELSGGQQQRVALARALAIRPRVLLLDEPLSNLDAALRQEMAREIRILQQAGGVTTIMVTHDQTEAMALADRLVVMREGSVQQIGTPEDVHLRPANPFVARFVGGSNVLPGWLDGGTRLVLAGGNAIALAGHYARDGDATLAVRPDSVLLAPPGGDSCI
jgi:putative spermidine/putrescine transport system ATP-binding protein